MKQSRKKSLQKKLATAVSIVNLLNAMAPIALPYVEVGRNVRHDAGAGDRARSYTEALEGACYARAYAASTSTGTLSEDTTVSSGDTLTVDSQTQYTVSVYGTATVTSMTGGTQNIYAGGNGTVTTMSGG